MNRTSEGHASSVRILKDVAELKRLAEAATPGPWFKSANMVGPKSTDDDQSYGMVIDVAETSRENAEPDAAYIACANPAAILELLAQRDELLAALEDMNNGWKYIRRTHGDLYGVGWDRAEQKADAAIANTKGTP